MSLGSVVMFPVMFPIPLIFVITHCVFSPCFLLAWLDRGLFILLILLKILVLVLLIFPIDSLFLISLISTLFHLLFCLLGFNLLLLY